MDCEKGSDFNVEAGLFLAIGPYSGQVQQCDAWPRSSLGIMFSLGRC